MPDWKMSMKSWSVYLLHRDDVISRRQTFADMMDTVSARLNFDRDFDPGGIVIAAATLFQPLVIKLSAPRNTRP